MTEAWSVENYQQLGTVAHRKNSGSDAIENNCIPYAVKGRTARIIVHDSVKYSFKTIAGGAC